MSHNRDLSQKVGILGPVLPFRGGIAQHTTMLHRTLSAISKVCTVSFTRQYPAWLYPGRGEFDPSYKDYREPEVMYIVDSMNPTTWLKAYRAFVDHNAAVVVMPWWTAFWAPAFGLMAKALSRRGSEVVFLCHNVLDHEKAVWKRLLSRAALGQGSRFVVQCLAEADLMRVFVPNADISVYPHPVFSHFPAPVRQLPRRARLELLFFGLVRPYKGLDLLLRAVEILHDKDIALTIAGEWWQRDRHLRRTAESLNERVEIIDRYLTEVETAELFSRADAAVLPYRSASGSGVVSLAYRYGKPVIAAAVGSIPEVVEDGVSGVLFKPGDPEALAAAVMRFLDSGPPDMAEGVTKVSGKMTWEGLAAVILGRSGGQAS